MAVTPVWKDNDYVSTPDRVYMELQVTTRAEMATLSTDGYAVGSEAFCTEDFSMWTLGYNGSDLEWLEVTI